MKRIPQIFVS